MKPLILTIDVLCGRCAVGIFKKEMGQITPLFETSIAMERGQAEAIVPMIKDSLMQANISMDQLSVIGLTIGPGSYTGIRIGMAVAEGLRFSLKIPVIGVSVVQARIESLSSTQQQACAVILASGRGNYFISTDGKNIDIAAPEAILDRLKGLKAKLGKTLTLCGDGVMGLSPFFKAHMEATSYILDASPLPLKSIATLGLKAYEMDQDHHPLTPLYAPPP